MDPDSAGSQFYFCLGAQHNLDSGYTVFGTTVEGLDVISQLRAGDEIVHVEIVHEVKGTSLNSQLIQQGRAAYRAGDFPLQPDAWGGKNSR